MCDKDADIRTEPELHILYNFETSKDYKKFRQVGQSTGLCLQSSGAELKLYLWLFGVVESVFFCQISLV